KQIEANGIAAFQRTVREGISASYPRWRGIEATLALALARNSKIVVIAGFKAGLAVILVKVHDADAVAYSKGTTTDGAVEPNEKTSAVSLCQINRLATPVGHPSTAKGTDMINAASSSTPPDVVQKAAPAKSSATNTIDKLKNYVPQIPDWLRPGTSGSGSGTA